MIISKLLYLKKITCLMVYMDNGKPPFKSQNHIENKIDKINEKFFYKYLNLQIKEDSKGNNKIYTIENLANNQLYFSDPTTFNDPFDCKFSLDHTGTREQWINFYKLIGYNHEEAVKFFNKNLKTKVLTKESDQLYSYDYIKHLKLNIERGLLKKENNLVYNLDEGSRKQIGNDMNDYLRTEGLPKVSCFSGTERSILMWSRYADYHKGICLKFKSYKHMFKLNESIWGDFLINNDFVQPDKEYYLLDLYVTKNKSFPSVFYNIHYKDEPPRPINIFGKDKKFFKFLTTKYTDWKYEDEYRLIDHYILENNLLNYRKEDLEGVIFGLKINYKDAKLVYDTIKQNYLDKGINVNFYEAKEVRNKYEVKAEPIINVEKYLDDIQSIV